MKLMLIGATGTIGAAVAAALSPRHEVVAVTRHSSPLRVDIASGSSIRELFDAGGPPSLCARGRWLDDRAGDRAGGVMFDDFDAAIRLTPAVKRQSGGAPNG
jgi:nucleoside-diphosphate-sugar epimerase